MTEQELGEIEARLAATSRQADGSQPWEVSDFGNDVYCGDVFIAEADASADVVFIARAPTDMRALIDEVRRLRGTLQGGIVDRYRQALGDAQDFGNPERMAQVAWAMATQAEAALRGSESTGGQHEP